jgi:hypothetical protein
MFSLMLRQVSSLLRNQIIEKELKNLYSLFYEIRELLLQQQQISLPQQQNSRYIVVTAEL